ncbi:hypothetical protein [Miniimonas sp. S16]|uniref:hypothetical protein n=1 Tax=Miniimonas sp. S16 TaxID=2171623 RepID=UPI000D529D7B|nr:hypothetical protein [Miniimonas sp. S16]
MLAFFEFATIIVGVLTLVGALYTWHHQARLTREQRVRDLELVYVQRYWSIRERMSIETRSDASRAIDPRDRTAVADYLELCEDEIDARQRGWISDDTWSSWAAAIRGAAGNEVLMGMLVELDREERLFTHLRSKKANDDGWDPCTLPKRDRLRQGLMPQYRNHVERLRMRVTSSKSQRRSGAVEVGEVVRATS